MAWVILILASVIVFMPMQQRVSAFPDPSWYNTNWSYRKQITIDHTKVDANLDNFLVLVDLSDSDLSKAKDNGDDILFTKSDGTTKLDHEIESFDGENLIAWAGIPSLSSTENTVIYMYYGNPGASNQENVEGVWDDNFVLVQHLNETSGMHYDSTSNHNDGTPENGVKQDAVGQVDGADDFDGSNDYVEVPDSASLDIISAVTIEAWIKPSAFTYEYSGIVCKWDWKSGVAWQRSYAMYLMDYDNVWFLLSNDGAWHDASQLESATALSTGTWYYIALTYDGSVMRIHINGVQDVEKSATLTIYDGAANVSIGASLKEGAVAADEETFNGTVDEVRISNVARSADWIKTCYNNENSPGTFYSVGSEEEIVRGVKVTISPAENSGSPGETLTYTVTVNNTGNVPDNYSLENSDNMGWVLSLDNDLLTIPAGENRTTTLRVTIPKNAPACTKDSITIIATSQMDNTVENSASCIAHAAEIRKVDVSISPSSKSGAPGDTLDYKVTVRNKGNISDTYDLKASGGWSARISPSSLTLAAGASSTATLTVTVPSGASGGASTTITVTVTSQVDSSVSDSASCTAAAVVPPPTPPAAPPTAPPTAPTGPRAVPTAPALPVLQRVIVVAAVGVIILLVVYLLRRP